jgi:4a-hydroxytetrahydrobiopterin dehydratase
MNMILEKQMKKSNGSLKGGWELVGAKLKMTTSFKNFKQVVRFVNKITETAEKLNHHPDLKIYSFKKLDVIIYSHDVGGLTKKDFKLAKLINEINKSHR